ncbi:MAG: ChuX/HutX family heme-like substrate-binding protein [Pseudomonadota bacterium]
MTAIEIDFADLAERERNLRAKKDRLRMRDAAEALAVPEAALLEARRADGSALRLKGPDGHDAGLGGLLDGLGAAGEVMALTRNAHCVHEKHGTYAKPEWYGAMGQTLGEIDLRLFCRSWAYAYALTEETEAGERRSLQIFNPSGEAIHKTYPTAGTDKAAWSAILDAARDDVAPAATYEPTPAAKEGRSDGEVDVAALRKAWSEMTHSHDFFMMLRDQNVGRAQALRLAGSEFAWRLDPAAAQAALEAASVESVPIMVFVGNPGCMQIHSGPVEVIKPMGPWINVLDARFNLHLRTDRIAEAWAVVKPSTGGVVHSVELYAEDGSCFCQFFGERPPGEAERDDWRTLASALPRL